MVTSPTPVELERIANALGAAFHVPYAPPFVYPMSAPVFIKSPCAVRDRPSGAPLGLYIHVPFCNYACTFCFYDRRVGGSYKQMARYVKALNRELEWVEPGTQLAQLYVGGGTPTALPAGLLDEVLTAVFERMRPRGGDVHTVECSPESISAEHVRVLRSRGVSRVSVGIQTLDDRILSAIRRRHSGEEALAACDLLVESGLVVNVDLIYGLPGQTEAGFRSDFEAVAARGVHSVCAYSLRVNEWTPVVRAIREDEHLDLSWLVRWRVAVQRTAEELGFKPTRWHVFQRTHQTGLGATEAVRFKDGTGAGNQLGIGMSARSRLGSTIYRNHTDLHVYLDRIENGQSPVEEIFPLSDDNRKIRFIALTLGEGKPLEREAYCRSFDRQIDDDYGELLRRLREAGLVEDAAGQIALTEMGKFVYDLVTLAFYPLHVQEWLGERQRAALAKGRSPLRQREEGRSPNPVPGGY
jgi:oxygen-independent coproporphyrinogen-3 oxidase